MAQGLRIQADWVKLILEATIIAFQKTTYHTPKRERPVMSDSSPVQLSITGQVTLQGEVEGLMIVGLERSVAIALTIRQCQRPIPGITNEVREVVSNLVEAVAAETIKKFSDLGRTVHVSKPMIAVSRIQGDLESSEPMLTLPFTYESGMFDVRIRLTDPYAAQPTNQEAQQPTNPQNQTEQPSPPQPVKPKKEPPAKNSSGSFHHVLETITAQRAEQVDIKDELIEHLRSAITDQAQRHHEEMEDLVRRARELENAKKSEEELRRLTEEQLDMYDGLLKQFQAANAELKQTNEQLAKANEELAEQATRDGLTKLYNHRVFQERLEEEVRRSIRYGSELSLVMLDIDHFKKINDTYGHPFGDTVLVKIAEMLLQELREIDIAARYGGEEFALVLLETSGWGANACAERLRKRIVELSFECDGKPVQVTGSFGVASWSDGDLESRDQLVKRADQSLYKAKHSGRDQVVCWIDLDAADTK